MVRQDEFGYYSKMSFWKWARKALVDKRIIRVDNQPFPDGAGGIAHDPVMYLDNGTILSLKPRVTVAGDVSIWLAVNDIEQPPDTICIHDWTPIRAGGFVIFGLRGKAIWQCVKCFEVKEN